jgi:cytoskeletal protein RodZ
MNIFKTILNFVPSILTIPFYIGSFLYLILLPDITYYALGIYLDIWIPALRTFWGFPILFILLMIPFVSMILVWLLTFQSFWVLFKFLIGSYYPRDELLGFVTMYPAAVVIISYTVSYILSKKEDTAPSTNSTARSSSFPRNQDTPASNTREEDSATDRASSSSEAKTRGESSTAARAARAASSSEANSSEAKTRGETSKAARAARAASSSEVSKRRRSSTASRAAEASSKNPTKETSSEVDDIFFDNRRKK